MKDNVKGGALTEVTFYILLALYTPRHGYGILKFVEAETNGRLRLGAGSLYGALSTLQAKGWIRPLGGGSDRKKEFVITPEGRTIAAKELLRLRQLVHTAEQIVGGADK